MYIKMKEDLDMSDYYDFHSGEHYEESRMSGCPVLPEGIAPTPDPENRNFRHKKNRKNSLGKRIASLTLSAVLFGAIAAGTFQSINYFSDGAVNAKSSSENQEAASAGTSGTDTGLLKNTSASGEGTSNKGSLDVTDIAKEAMPSIVAITSRSVQEVESFFSQYGYGGGYFGEPQTQETESSGSGIIIGKNESELLIVTNNHVIQGADTLSVSFVDNEVYEANVKGTDADLDLAVIAVPLESISEDTSSKITVATIGDSDALQVGEQVVAIGNALGYGQSVTTGIVSAINRTITESGYPEEESQEDVSGANTYIQTDAAINPGNSGGALLNMDGEVIGINSAKLASTEVEGMGYAIPVSKVSDIIENLMNQTTRSKASEGEQGALGIQGTDITTEAQEVYGFPQGVYISEVTAGGAAESAGIASGNILTSFDGQEITSISQLKDLLQYYKAGEGVQVTLQVPGGNGYEEKTVSVILGNSADTQSQEQIVDEDSLFRR